MNYTIENKGGVNLLHIGDTVRPATDAEVDLVAQLGQVKSTNYAKLYGMVCEALDHNGLYAQLQPSGDWFDLVRKGPEPTTDIFEAYKTWPEDLRARLSANDLRRMSGWKPQSKEDQVTDALEGASIIDAHQAMERRIASLRTPQSSGEKLSHLMTKDVAEDRIVVPVEDWKHPDTVRLDWLEKNAAIAPYGVCLHHDGSKTDRKVAVTLDDEAPREYVATIRDAIDLEILNGD